MTLKAYFGERKNSMKSNLDTEKRILLNIFVVKHHISFYWILSKSESKNGNGYFAFCINH